MRGRVRERERGAKCLSQEQHLPRARGIDGRRRCIEVSREGDEDGLRGLVAGSEELATEATRPPRGLSRWKAQSVQVES